MKNKSAMESKKWEIWKYVELTDQWVLDKIGTTKEIAARHNELKNKCIKNYIRARGSSNE